MFVRVEAIHRIAEKYIWHSCFHRCFEKLFEQIFRFDDFFERQSVIIFKFGVEFFKFCVKSIFKAFPIQNKHFMRIKKRPIFIIFYAFHEQIWYRNRWKNIKTFGTNITRFGLQFEKIVNIAMENIERYRNRTKALSELIHSNRSIIDNLDPRRYTASRALDSTNHRCLRANMSEVHAHTAAKFGNLRDIFNRVIDSAQIVRNIDFKTTCELMPVRSRIIECRRCERNFLWARVIIHFESKIQAIFLFFWNRIKKRHRHIELLRKFANDFIWIEQISLGERQNRCVSVC